jgi:hypothetical protein
VIFRPAHSLLLLLTGCAPSIQSSVAPLMGRPVPAIVQRLGPPDEDAIRGDVRVLRYSAWAAPGRCSLDITVVDGQATTWRFSGPGDACEMLAFRLSR